MNINKNEKKLLLLLKGRTSLQFDNVKDEITIGEFDDCAWSLKSKNLIDAIFNEKKHCAYMTINQNGKAYLLGNHKTKNSYLTENKKWIITTIISILAILVSIYVVGQNQ